MFFDWAKIDKIIREWLKANELIPEFLKVDSPIVLLEHFAAGFGLPAFATGIACLLVCRRNKLERKNQRLKAEIVVLFAAFLSILAYAVYESWHEALQLTLAKRSNFGQFLVDKCIPAETIKAFGMCSKNYIVMVQQQLIADGLGMLTFVCVFFALLYRFKRDEPVS